MEAVTAIAQVCITDVAVSAYKIPTETPESDGTLKWNSTTIVLVKVHGGGKTGLGYSYVHHSAAVLIQTVFRDLIKGMNCFNTAAVWNTMVKSIRNLGNSGIAMMAVSAVDCALWDLKAKLLCIPLVKLFGSNHNGMPVYGSGGFTSYSLDKLQNQLSKWVSEGINKVKMKIGREPEKDCKRVETARKAIGSEVELFVDANGAFDAKQAINKAYQLLDYDVSWFEEPVSSDDLKGLHFIKEHVPPTLEIAAGEYGFNRYDFRNMLQAAAVDVIQIDITRCGGVTGFINAAKIAEEYLLPISSHCAPSLHLHIAPSFKRFRHAEYFFDHVRIEKMFFDGFIEPKKGVMVLDSDRPGFGLEFKHQDAEEFRI